MSGEVDLGIGPKLNEPRSQKGTRCHVRTSNSGQLALTRRLIRVFDGHSMGSRALIVSSGGKQSLY